MHHNWNLHKGCELDLVAQKDGELHFIEVKTRRRVHELYGGPEQAINATKMRNMQKAIAFYTQYYHLDSDTPLHMDDIAIVFRAEGDFDLEYNKDIYYFEFTRNTYQGRKRGYRYF